MSDSWKASGPWYIRKRGQIMGPYQSEQINQLRMRGQIARFQELSTDKQSWQTAEAIGLFEVVVPKQIATSEDTQQDVTLIPAYATLKKENPVQLKISLGVLTVGYLIDTIFWILVGLTVYISILSDRFVIFQVTGMLLVLQYIIVSTIMIVSFSLGWPANYSSNRKVFPVVSLVLHVIDLLLILIWMSINIYSGGIAGAAGGLDAANYIINGLRLFIGIAITVSLIEWVRGLNSTSNTPQSGLIYFYLLYGLQLILLLFMIFVVLVGPRDVWMLRFGDKGQIYLLLLIMFIIYSICFLGTSIWKLVILERCWRRIPG